ncbi:MAG: hypothetical protein AUK47_04795 [Deltaproteobacteria bacterium CG2_30_63_29]|nr:MAG: hypothetical protein AUK47_04795 [Deltaproteobacteria bacterium CG2_30_63_29]PIV99187.1 MAG: hypothetical protein COW42_11830 [Deltaproteobacteria bacterium CG17_big_fil_post_rev_8_21_14_2_50_63_7]PJB42962.1 MAG: hypothetical protein CO108_10900 [Deltaproteobacteria bacterium CG_4_9_14_3_um_filter_63_12]
MQQIARAPQPGDIISDRYEILAQIGVGGFGAVYRARQIGMSRDVAIKTLLPHLCSVEGVEERFQREARLASDLASPHTIRLYDFGKTAEGMLYMAMELLKGEELEERLKRDKAISPQETKEIAIQILDSLAEAHMQGIVHRDLKPSNIYLTEVGRSKHFVKVLDFGIAKMMTTEGGDQKLTATGQALGTPYYMAPEQIRGKDVGAHTDIYALGLMLIEMLTGRVAVQGATPLETVLLHVNPDPIPMPDWLRQSPLGLIIASAVEKDVQRRYVSCENMIADLERIDVRDMAAGPHVGGQQQPFRPETGRLPAQGSGGYSFDSGQVSQIKSGPVPTGPYGYQNQSGMMQPGMGQSGMMQPGMGQSGMMQPGMGQSGMMHPGMSQGMGMMQSGPIDYPPKTSGATKIILAVLIALVLLGAGAFVLVLNQSGGEESKAAANEDETGNKADKNGELAATTEQETDKSQVPVDNPPKDGATLTPPTDGDPVADTPPVDGDPVADPTTDPIDPVADVEMVKFQITSTPEGADIYQNDEMIGKTPMEFELPKEEGSMTLVLKYDRREDETIELDLKKGGTHSVKLKKAHGGSVAKVDPPVADVKPKDPPKEDPKVKAGSIAVDDEPPPVKKPKKEEKKPGFAVD